MSKALVRVELHKAQQELRATKKRLKESVALPQHSRNEMRGVLRKRSRHGIWQTRYFVTSGQYLRYYRSVADAEERPDATSRKTYNLLIFSNIFVHRSEVRFKSSQGGLRLRAASIGQADSWVRFLAKRAVQVRADMQKPSDATVDVLSNQDHKEADDEPERPRRAKTELAAMKEPPAAFGPGWVCVSNVSDDDDDEEDDTVDYSDDDDEDKPHDGASEEVPVRDDRAEETEPCKLAAEIPDLDTADEDTASEDPRRFDDLNHLNELEDPRANGGCEQGPREPPREDEDPREPRRAEGGTQRPRSAMLLEVGDLAGHEVDLVRLPPGEAGSLDAPGDAIEERDHMPTKLNAMQAAQLAMGYTPIYFGCGGGNTVTCHRSTMMRGRRKDMCLVS